MRPLPTSGSVVLALMLLFAALPSIATAQFRANITGSGVFKITGYTCPPFCNKTASGSQVRLGVVSVDPEIIPLGATVEIEGLGTFKAEDTGGGVRGNHIDVFVTSEATAYQITGTYAARWYQEKVRENQLGEKAKERRARHPDLLLPPDINERKTLCLLFCPR